MCPFALLNDHSAEYIASGICVHLQIMYGSGLIGCVDNHPTNLLQPFNEYIASGDMVHLQIINIAIQLNTLQVGYGPLADYCMVPV